MLSIERSKSKNIIVSLIFCYFIFPFWLKGISSIMSLLLYGISAGIIIFQYKFLFQSLAQNKNTKYFICWLILFLVLIASVFCIAGVYKTGDISYLGFISSQLRSIIRFVGVYLIACTLLKKNLSGEDYRKFFVNGVCIYVITSLILLIPVVRNIWQSIVFLTEVNMRSSESLSYYTRFGLQGFSGFMHSCLCDVAILFCLNKNKISKIDVFKICLLFVGNILYGRIGLIGGLILIIFYLIKRFKKKISIKFILSIVLICGVIVSTFFYLYNQNQDELWFRWAFEPIVNLIEGNGVGSQSSDRLQEMWFCPSAETIILGDGRYTDRFGAGYYMFTDVGTLRKLLFGGIGFLFLVYLSDMIPILTQYDRRKHNLFLIMSALFLMAMYEYKGEASIYISTAFFPLLFTGHKNKEIK